MRPVDTMPASTAAAIRGVLVDIDGTLTNKGKLTAAAYQALWRLKAAQLRVVPVTGRPAGWCDLIARQWPVDGVVGENGALAFWEEAGGLERLVHPQVADGSARTRLDQVREAILARVPGARVAKDQAYRSYDLAIDFCEEPPDLGLDAARAIKAIFEEHGARAKISNIHVNGWFGSYDKLSMMQYFARRVWGEDPETLRSAYLFCGDSPNDEAMFAFFPNACAVANIVPFTHDLGSLPRFVASREGGDGFAEIVDVILRGRQGSRE